MHYPLLHLKRTTTVVPQAVGVVLERLSSQFVEVEARCREDKRAEVPDIGIGNFTLSGTSPVFKLRFGIEAKASTESIRSLPPPSTIIDRHDVVTAFSKLFLQTRDQAKAAIKNNYPITDNGTVDWILLVGPYWALCTFGPFTAAELEIRARKRQTFHKC